MTTTMATMAMAAATIAVAGAVTPMVLTWTRQWAQEWVWTPLSLVHTCRSQGIPGFTVWKASSWMKGLSWESFTSMQKHGKGFYIRCGKFVRLVILEPSTIHEILVQNADFYEKPSFVTSLEILGEGLFSSSGKRWASQRQLFGQYFLPKALKTHFEAIKACTEKEMQRWHDLDQKVVDIHKEFLSLTVKLIGGVAFGDTVESHTAAKIYKTFDHYLQNCKRFVCNPFFTLPGHRLLYKWKTAADKLSILSFIEGVVARRQLRSYSLCPEDSRKEGLLLDLMLDKQKENTVDFTPKLMLDNIATFLLNGHETTASLLTWTIYLLAVYPQWQEKARAEVSGIKDLVDTKQLSQMKTINMILWESLRLFPPQPILGRSCVCENKVGHLVIPQKMEVICPVFALHRDKEAWGEDPDEFRPTRFAHGIHKATTNPLSFLPFGVGPRTCIGQSLAFLESRIVLCLMLQKFSWKLGPNYQHCPDVTLTLQPKYGMPIVLSIV